MKESLCKGSKDTKRMFDALDTIPTFRAYSVVVSLVLMSTVSALNQSQPLLDADVVYDPIPDSSSCCDVEFKGPSKVPGLDFLTYRVTDCNETTGESGTLSSSILSSLPHLSKVEMCTNIDGDFNLNFILSLSLEDIIKGRITDVQVTFGAPPGGGSNPRYFRPICRQFSFAFDRSLLPVNNAVDKVDIPNSCLARNLDEGAFTLQIKPLPWLQQLDYQLVWAYFYDYSDVGIWNQLLVGVAPIPTANQIAVVFQPPKSENLVEKLLLELLSFPEKLVNSSMIPPSQTSFIFHDMSEGRYWVKVTPLSHPCQIDNDICPSVSSPEVLLFRQPGAQPAERPKSVNARMKDDRSSNEDGFSGLGDTGMVAGAVVLILGLPTVLFALVFWLVIRKRSRHGHMPTLHMISPALSPLEIKAVQHLAMALSNGLGIPVTLTLRNSPVHDGPSDSDQLVLMVHPDSDSTDCQEKDERSPCVQKVSNKNILALVAFSHSQDYLPFNRSHAYDDFSQNPDLFDIVANISDKSYQNIIFILFTEQTQPPKLYFSISEGSGKSMWDENENDSDYQLTIPLRPPKSQKESDILSICHPQKFCFQKLLSSCNTFYVPQKTQQLYHHLKTRVLKLDPGHKFPPADDIANNEKWIAAHTVAQSVLRGQSLFCRDDAANDFPGTCLTIDAVSLCGLTDNDVRSQNRFSLEEDLHICPPRDIVADNICFDFNADCDSFSNFSEMRRDLSS